MNLPEDILMEILLRLPVLSLIRFKFVSKTWNVLIDSPRLVDMHLNLQLTKGNEHIHILRSNPDCIHNFTSFDDYESLSRLALPPDVEVPGYEDSGRYLCFAGDANGIVCITDYLDYITLWNPALREFRMLPPRSLYFPPAIPGSDPTGFRVYVLFIGFAFDDATNDYKVVFVERFVEQSCPYPSPIIVVQVYNLVTNSWRILESTCESVIDYSPGPFCSPIFFEGNVHWLLRDLFVEKWCITTFNITNELFGEVHCPHGCELYYSPHSLVSLFVLDKSTLSMVVVYQQADESSCWVDVWVINDYNMKDSWTKLYCGTTSIPKQSYPLLFWKKDKLLFVTGDDAGDDPVFVDDVLISYDLPTGQHHRPTLS